MSESENVLKQRQAAAYIRMSTSHQEFSPAIQRNFLQEYAKKNNLVLIREFIDAGVSGVVTEKRTQFLALIKLVESGQADFSHILVYDTSRWGRFPDPTEASYHEFACKRMGVLVHRCADPIPISLTEDDLTAVCVMNAVEQVGAAKFSKNLSHKVFLGQKNLIELGFRQGGPAGYGLRRLLVDSSGQHKFLLEAGEHKSIQTDRVILVPGPEYEQEIVRQIYDDFALNNKSESQIADELNSRNILTDRSTAWTRGVVHQILINEKYIGNNVWNKCTSSAFKTQKGKNPVDQWIRADEAFQPIVSTVLFNAAQAIINKRSYRWSDDAMLNILKEMLAVHSHLSGMIIDEADDSPSSSVYRNRFGSLIKCYSLIGYTPERDYHYLEINRLLRQMYSDIVSQTILEIEKMGGTVVRLPENDLLHINHEFFVSLVLARCQTTPIGTKRWFIRFDRSLNPDLTIAIRLDETAKHVLDYHLLPMDKRIDKKIRLTEQNPIEWDIYRHQDLSRFFDMTKRILIKEAAL